MSWSSNLTLPFVSIACMANILVLHIRNRVASKRVNHWSWFIVMYVNLCLLFHWVVHCISSHSLMMLHANSRYIQFCKRLIRLMHFRSSWHMLKLSLERSLSAWHREIMEESMSLMAFKNFVRCVVSKGNYLHLKILLKMVLLRR